MSNTLEEKDWELLLRRIKQGRCMPFLGAGAAFGALPLAAEVAHKWAERHNYPLNDIKSLPQVAQFLAVHYDSQFPKEDLVETFKECIPPNYDAPDEPHGALADLPLPIYMTTNYDNFMACALENRKRKFKREISRWNKDTKKQRSAFDEGYSPTPECPVVFHLHGILEQPKSMVLTEDDYLDFLVRMSIETATTTKVHGASSTAEPSLLPVRIEEAFADSTLLFLGYGLSDWDFRVLFRALVEYLERSSSRSHVSVQVLPVEEKMPEDQKQNVQRYFDEYYRRLQIRVYWGSCREFISELKRRWEVFHGK